MFLLRGRLETIVEAGVLLMLQGLRGTSVKAGVLFLFILQGCVEAT